MNNIDKLAGVVILAGGASKRMGTPKAELTLPNNERLLDYHVRQAMKLTVPILIADNGRDFQIDSTLLSSATMSISHIADYHSTATVADSETQGPLVAIESAMQAVAKPNDKGKVENTQASQIEASWLIVISCDSLITAYDLWQALGAYTTAKATAKSVVCLTDDSHLYPLLGLYKLTIEPELKAYIDSGKRQVMAFIKPMTEAVPVTKEWQPLTNLNTPADFKRACTALDVVK